MARVPVVQPFQERIGSSPMVDHSPLLRTAGDFGESAARELGNTADALSEYAFKEQARLDDIALREADTALIDAKTTLLNDPETGYFTQRGKGAIDAYQATVDSYDAEVERVRSGLSSHLHEKLDAMAGARKATAVSAMSTYRRREEERYEDDTSEARLNTTLNDAVANWSDPDSRRQAFITAGDELLDMAERKGWSPEVLADKQATFKESVHAATLDSIIQSDFNGAKRYLAENRAEMGLKTISAAERAIESEQRHRVAEYRRSQSLSQAHTKAVLDVAILEGRVGPDQIDQAYQAGQITSAAWASLRGQYATAAVKREKEAKVFEIVAAGGPLDPTDTDHKDAVDSIFRSAGGIEGLVNRDPDTAKAVADISSSTGIIPPSVQSFIRGAIASGDDAHRQYAYDLIARLDETAGTALDRTFTGPELTEATQYIKLTKAGVSDAQAMIALEENRALDQNTRDVRRKEGAKAFEDVNVEDAFFDPSVLPFNQGSLPAYAPLADNIREDARAVFTDAYTRTGDAEVAETITRRTLGKTYGQSSVAGSGSVMQYPPELFYAIPGIDNEWMTEQLVEDVRAFVPDIGKESIELVPTPRTAADVRAGEAPRYQVLVMDEDGIYQPVMQEDGAVLDYRFDPSKPRDAMKLDLEAQREEYLKSQTTAPHALTRGLNAL